MLEKENPKQKTKKGLSCREKGETTMKRCKSCHYRREMFGFPKDPACHYAIEEGRLRGCEPEECTHYRPKKKSRAKPSLSGRLSRSCGDKAIFAPMGAVRSGALAD